MPERQPFPLLHPPPAAAAWLEEVEASLMSVARADGGATKAILDYVTKTRGKRLRPLLTLLSAEAFGSDPAGRDSRPGQERQALRDLAVGIELVHIASLLHDDLIDGAAERRGLPTVVSRWGPAVAVLAGDFLFSAAFQHLVARGFYGGVRLLSSALRAMSEAEIEQQSSLYRVETTEDEYYRWIRGKTGSLFGAACAAGAEAGAAAPGAIELARRFGERLGTAYQLTDDLLDIVGRAESLGKPTGQDITRGQLTLPVIFLLRRARAAAELAAMISSRECGPECAAWVRELAVSEGAVDYALGAIRRELDEAWDSLRAMPEAAWLHARALFEPVAGFVLAWAAGDNAVFRLSQAGPPQAEAQGEKPPGLPPGLIEQEPRE